jgi:hypothetical protein
MKDIKAKYGWAGDEYWPQFSMVTVKGNDLAKAFPEGVSQQDGEKIVQSWDKAAVLQTDSNIQVYFGFMVGDTKVQLLNQPITTSEGKFAVRVGDKEVTFFVLAVDLKSRPFLRLVEITDINNPNYAELQLY